MSDVADTAGFVPMSKETRGKSIQERRLALGIDSEVKFAHETGVDRGAIRRAEAGKGSDRTYLRLESWLDRYERKIAADVMGEAAVTATEGEEGSVIVRASGIVGVAEITWQGPVENLAEITAAAAELIREVRDAPAKDS